MQSAKVCAPSQSPSPMGPLGLFCSLNGGWANRGKKTKWGERGERWQPGTNGGQRWQKGARGDKKGQKGGKRGQRGQKGDEKVKRANGSGRGNKLNAIASTLCFSPPPQSNPPPMTPFLLNGPHNNRSKPRPGTSRGTGPLSTRSSPSPPSPAPRLSCPAPLL